METMTFDNVHGQMTAGLQSPPAGCKASDKAVRELARGFECDETMYPFREMFCRIARHKPKDEPMEQAGKKE